MCSRFLLPFLQYQQDSSGFDFEIDKLAKEVIVGLDEEQTEELSALFEKENQVATMNQSATGKNSLPQDDDCKIVSQSFSSFSTSASNTMKIRLY